VSLRFASSLQTTDDSDVALERAVQELRAGLGEARPDLVLGFVSHHHGAAIEDLGPRLARATGARVVLGCTGEGILGAEREVERGAALAVWGAVLGDTQLTPFAVQAWKDDEGELGFTELPSVRDRARAALLLLADPFTFPMSDYLQVLDTSLPGVPAIGGMASGGSGPGQNLLFTQDGLVEGGALGLVIEGEVEVRAIVSQGCKPVGKPFVITSCEGNLIRRLGGQTAIEALVATFGSLEPRERERLQKRPFVGLALDARKQSYERGDFLVRGIVGADNEKGALAIGDDTLRVGQTVQFLVRDASSAGEDLEHLVQQRAGAPGDGPGERPGERGALVFSCNGRGTRMFARPDHDIGCVQRGLGGAVPAAGFFALGEIGPVGGRNFLHGFTASVALFRRRQG